MLLTDQRYLDADPGTVWAAVLDPEVLRLCIPGCQSLSGTPEAGYEAVVAQKVGPLKARFVGHVTLSDIEEFRAVTITGEGRGGAAGHARGLARLRLEPAGLGTDLAYEVEVQVGGKLAQLGSRIIDGFTRRMADQFFTRFQAAVEGPAEDAEAEGADPGEAKEPGEAAPAKTGWFRRVLSR